MTKCDVIMTKYNFALLKQVPLESFTFSTVSKNDKLPICAESQGYL